MRDVVVVVVVVVGVICWGSSILHAHFSFFMFLKPPPPFQPGTYSPGGLSACLSCTDGYSCTPAQQTLCPLGMWSPATSETCTPCDPGYLCTSPPYVTSAPAAAIFAQGGWCEFGTTRHICPDGTYGNVLGRGRCNWCLQLVVVVVVVVVWYYFTGVVLYCVVLSVGLCLCAFAHPRQCSF